MKSGLGGGIFYHGDAESTDLRRKLFMSRCVMVGVLFVYALGVLVLHGMPFVGIDVEEVEFGPVKAAYLVHLSMFVPWGMLGLPYICRRVGGRFIRGCSWMALGMAFAVFAEGTQYFIPYRSFSFLDLFCNLTGVFLGMLAVAIWRCRSADGSGFCRA